MIRRSLFLLVALSLAGCATYDPYPSYQYYPQPPQPEVRVEKVIVEREVPVQMDFRERIEHAKVAYLNCRFKDSIESLLFVLQYQVSAQQRAECYLYLGADYFYLYGDEQQARECFRRALGSDPTLQMPTEVFPPELVTLFSNSR